MQNNTPLNAPLPVSRMHDVKEFIFAAAIIGASFSAGYLILKNADGLNTTANQANVLQAVSLPQNNY
jgi:hypothetical protein